MTKNLNIKGNSQHQEKIKTDILIQSSILRLQSR